MDKKLVIIGLDGLDPTILDTLLPDLPTFSILMGKGSHGPLKSCDPPITVPAWTVMSTGRDPGELGIYGFTNKVPGRYDTFLADATMVRDLRLWDFLGAEGGNSIILGMPQTAPAQPLNGLMVGGQLAGTSGPLSVYPPYLAPQIDGLAGGHYVPDTISHRRGNQGTILEEARQNTRSVLTLAANLASSTYWDLLWLVIMAPDRVQHAALPQDYNTLPHSPVADYYRYLDSQLADFCKKMPPDITLLIVSDHGTRPCKGGFWLNRWLRREGYLTLKSGCGSKQPFSPELIDWTKTSVYGQGGYYGRLYINVAGREAQGIVPSCKIDGLKNELANKLTALSTPWPESPNIVLDPGQIYSACRGQPPDLMLYPAGLAARAIGLLDEDSALWEDNNYLPGQLDRANHSSLGLFICNRQLPSGTLTSIFDIINYCRQLLK